METQAVMWNWRAITSYTAELALCSMGGAAFTLEKWAMGYPEFKQVNVLDYKCLDMAVDPLCRSNHSSELKLNESYHYSCVFLLILQAQVLWSSVRIAMITLTFIPALESTASTPILGRMMWTKAIQVASSGTLNKMTLYWKTSLVTSTAQTFSPQMTKPHITTQLQSTALTVRLRLF